MEVSTETLAGYFYFTPDTNYPWSGKSFQSMILSFTQGNIFGSTEQRIQYTNIYSIWRTKAQAAYTAYYNQTVPTTGAPPDISMGDFKNQYKTHSIFGRINKHTNALRKMKC